MKVATRFVPAFAIALCLVSIAQAQQNTASTWNKELGISFTYYVCVMPKNLSCKCPAKKDEESTCPKCAEWTKQERSFEVNLALKTSGYSYKSGPPRANVFVNDAARQIYGKGLPRNNVNHYITLHQLYQDPQKYGWSEVGAKQNKTGTLAVWPSNGGVVVADHSGETNRTSDSIQVLYPSAKKGGKLNQADVGSIDSGLKPKYLIPMSGGLPQKATPR